MNFSVPRETLLKPLQLLYGVVERRQTIPVLGNILLRLKQQQLSLTSSDLEIELGANIDLIDPAIEGEITVSARKLLDICKLLSDESIIHFRLEDNKLVLKSAKSRFNLVTLPANDFPLNPPIQVDHQFSLPQNQLSYLINETAFAMAQQDVRYYLNGTLWEFQQGNFNMVATDGHRLALSGVKTEFIADHLQVIVPRKSVGELARMLDDSSTLVHISLANNQIKVETDFATFRSKLIEGNFPDYKKIIGEGGDNILLVDRNIFRHTLQRVGVLSNDKIRGVTFELSQDKLVLKTHNHSFEEAYEEIIVDYSGSIFDISFNLNYLIDVLNVLPAGLIKLTFKDSESSVLVSTIDDKENFYIIMPMRL